MDKRFTSDRLAYSLRLEHFLPIMGLKKYSRENRKYEDENFQWHSCRSVNFSRRKFRREMLLLFYNTALFSSGSLCGLAYILANN